ncbi:BMP family ABC transporter substrate-binding protein [Mesorhizobium sp. BAC0120]|uniref:BMP family ABC transporter substrate-binding protein n=1 Tax=Mesorhizobium sp. BAC0120 TaxID=3090670 RepID=UPI00298CD89A|nr:BMP family ABC transporter substrate-binding protein [Mesorhizobium sp. BAC0120]MDW6023639.1 BMP family ABC transporter substrate-binding protein [Mesorhizobium sp. BAC0120]
MGVWKKSVAALSLAVTMAAGQASASDLLVYVSPDAIGVNAFLKMGQTGIEAAAMKHGMDFKTYESKTAAERRENVDAAVNEGAKVVVVLGFEFNDILKEVAPTAPDTQFLIVDQCIENQPDNVHCAVFREYEASYLMGVAAGMLTKSNTVGVVGAIDIPFLHRYTDGYAEGVKSVKPDAKVEVRWVGGDNPFADPVRAKEQAVALNATGADYIYTATAGGDFGVFEAAKEKGFKVFSVDVNHCPDVPGIIVDQSLKHVNVALGTAVDAILAGEKKTFTSLGIKEGGVGAVALDEAGMASSKCLIADHPDVAAKMREVAATIADGSLKLTDPMAAK